MRDNFRIEMLLKIEKRETSLFNNCDKIIDSLNLNDKLRIYQDGMQYKVLSAGQVFDFSITMEPSGDVFSITITTIMDTYDCLVLSSVLDGLTNVARDIKVTISENFKNCSYEVLWDDVGIYYATMAFPMIIKIENLMRKLITKFMLVPVGMEFFNNIPNDINVRDNRDSDSGFLHTIDFIELGKYIFAARPLKSTESLIKIINNLDENRFPENVNLLDYQYNSYWNRYFKDIIEGCVDTDGDIIKAQWEDLYKLRCKIAHSRFLRKDEYNKIHDLYHTLSNTFNFAIDKLSNISLSSESKELISENMSSEIDGYNWPDKLYGIICENFDDEFSLKEIYAYEPIFQAHYPDNHTIQSSIRRNLQKLRDNGKIIFLDNGRYKIKKKL